jgi:hypothetical protein
MDAIFATIRQIVRTAHTYPAKIHVHGYASRRVYVECCADTSREAVTAARTVGAALIEAGVDGVGVPTPSDLDRLCAEGSCVATVWVDVYTNMP